MGLLEGFLSGYLDKRGEIENENLRKAELQQERENKVFEALLNSPDDEIRSMAATGLIMGTQPKQKGRGFMQQWMGPYLENPVYPEMLRLMRSEKWQPPITVPGLKSRQGTGLTYIPQTPAQNKPAALPSTSPTQVGAPPPTEVRAYPPPTMNMGPVGLQPFPPATPPGPPAPPPMLDIEAPAAVGTTGATAEPPAEVTGEPRPIFGSRAEQAPPVPPAWVQRDVGAPAVGRTLREGGWQPRQVFPTVGDLAAQRKEADVTGEYQGALRMAQLAGEPDPEQWALDYMRMQVQRSLGAPYGAPREVEYEDEQGVTRRAFATPNRFNGQLELPPGAPRAASQLRQVRMIGGVAYQRSALDLFPGGIVPPGMEDLVIQHALELAVRDAYSTTTARQQATFNRPTDIPGSRENQVPVGTRASDLQGTTIARPPTDIQRRALAFYNRGKQAIEFVTAKDPGTQKSLEDRILEQGLARQLQGRYLWNPLQSTDQQMYTAQQRAFTEARLRKESGAAVPPFEYINDQRTYFVQPGDDPPTVARKAELRQQVLDGIANEAGPAYGEYYGEPYRRLGLVGTPPPTRQGGGAAAGGGGTSDIGLSKDASGNFVLTLP